ncbi:hypothetical protein GE09DRAFT_775158 [Coniochaeta sp. 2T2.1]|nr:hypothetical protein GE09DRAFT_775158 [Coniochaeta sp. 2T2.1]
MKRELFTTAVCLLFRSTYSSCGVVVVESRGQWRLTLSRLFPVRRQRALSWLCDVPPSRHRPIPFLRINIVRIDIAILLLVDSIQEKRIRYEHHLRRSKDLNVIHAHNSRGPAPTASCSDEPQLPAITGG